MALPRLDSELPSLPDVPAYPQADEDGYFTMYEFAPYGRRFTFEEMYPEVVEERRRAKAAAQVEARKQAQKAQRARDRNQSAQRCHR